MAAQSESAQVANGEVVQTPGIGNRDMSFKQVTLSSPTAVAAFLGVRWDGDKVRGIRMQLSDGTSAQAGGYDDVSYALSTCALAPGDKLSEGWLRDSGYGYGSVRAEIHAECRRSLLAVERRRLYDAYDPAEGGDGVRPGGVWSEPRGFLYGSAES
jgi:hypothetical protein